MIVRDGVLETYLLDCYSARRLELAATGSATRSPGAVPIAGPTNFHLKGGGRTPEEIVRSVKEGFYVTGLQGMGVNPVTGDYSRGANGIWIRGGEFAFPVEEVTISGNLKEMYRGLAAVGNDLRFRSAIASPTVLIEEMTVAGR